MSWEVSVRDKSGRAVKTSGRAGGLVGAGVESQMLIPDSRHGNRGLGQPLSVESLQQKVSARVTAELANALSTAVAGRSGQDAVRSLAHAYRDYALSHPGRYPLTQRVPTLRIRNIWPRLSSRCRPLSPRYVATGWVGTRQSTPPGWHGARFMASSVSRSTAVSGCPKTSDAPLSGLSRRCTLARSYGRFEG